MVAAESTRTVHIAGVPVQTTVTSRPGTVRQWVRATSWRLRSGAGLTVGMGIQWAPPSRRAGAAAPPRAATLHLCAEKRCLVFQLAQAGTVPYALRRFMADRSVTFVGYDVGSDCRKLRAGHGLDVTSTMELRGASGKDDAASVEEMAARLRGLQGVEKPEKVSASKWDVAKMSKKQVRYACTDAYISWRLGVHLRGGAGKKSSRQESDEMAVANQQEEN